MAAGRSTRTGQPCHTWCGHSPAAASPAAATVPPSLRRAAGMSGWRRGGSGARRCEGCAGWRSAVVAPCRPDPRASTTIPPSPPSRRVGKTPPAVGGEVPGTAAIRGRAPVGPAPPRLPLGLTVSSLGPPSAGTVAVRPPSPGPRCPPRSPLSAGDASTGPGSSPGFALGTVPKSAGRAPPLGLTSRPLHRSGRGRACALER